MDALKTERVMLRALLAAQPYRALFCAILAVIGLATAWLEPSEFRDILAPSLIAIMMAAFLAIAAVRLEANCRSAGALGIPGHLRHARRVQVILLLAFVASPAIYLLVMGFGWISLSATFAAGVIGVHLFRNPLLVWVVIALWIATRLGIDAWAFAFRPAGACVIVALAVPGFAAWLRSLREAHQQGVLESATLADARHEEAVAMPSNAAIDKLLAGTTSAGPNPSTFWGALGHVPATNRRSAAILVLTVAAAFIAMHAYRHGRADAAFFLAWSALAGLLAGWQFFAMQGAWATSANEQALLVLSPRWPGQRALKWLVIRTFWSRMPASLIAWLAVAGIGLAGRWITWPIVGRGAAGLFSVALALFGFLLLFLARGRLKKRNRLAMLYLVVTGIAGLLLVPFQKGGAWRVLCLMMVVPALLAVVAFCLRRPQFPVRPDADLVL